MDWSAVRGEMCIRDSLMTTLYNAPVTIHHYYQAEVQHDLAGE